MKLHFLRNGVSAYLTRDVRKKDPSAECALKWCVTYRRKQSYYQTGISLGPKEWKLFCDAEERDFDLKTKEANRLKEVKDDLTEYFEETLKPLIKELSDNFSFDALNTELFKGSRDSVNDAFDSKIELLTADNSIGNAAIYRTTYNALLKFKHYKNIKGKGKKEDFMQLCKQYRHITKGRHAVVVNDRISFDEITPKFLKDCDTFLREIGTSDASIGMYMRTFRAMIDAAPADKDHDELFTSLGILLDWAFTPIKFKAASNGIYSRYYRDLPPLQRGVLSGSLIYSKKESFEINTETNSVTIKPGIIKKIEDLYNVRMTTERQKDFLREMETIIEAFNRLREKAPELGLRWPSFAGNAIKGEQDGRASINIESAATLYIQHLK